MQAAAITSRFLTGCPSSSGFTDSEIVVSHGGLIQHIVSSRLAQTAHTQETFLNLTNLLIHFAEQAYSRRDPDALEEISSVLMNLPIDVARQVGLYYHALAINRRGQRDEAENLLEMVVDDAPIAYRARAIQTLGTNLHDRGHLDEALRFQLEALRVASDKNGHSLQTMLKVRFEMAILMSLNGDHEGALSSFEKLWPLVHHVAKQHPFYLYLFHNELAVELGEAGRVEEAESACKIALASPFAPAYPEWRATHDEIAAKRQSATPSVVAINRTPEAEPSPQLQPQRQTKTSKALALSRLASDKASFQRSIIPIPAIATTALRVISILDRVLICIGPRAPPALY